MTDAELAKAQAAKSRAEAAKILVTAEWYFISEFGYHYGWDGVEAILTNKIDFATAQMLLEGARKVWYKKQMEQASATRIAMVAALSKNGNQVMTKGFKQFEKAAKIDE